MKVLVFVRRRAHAVDRDLDAVDGWRQHHAVRQEEGELLGLPPAAGRPGGHPLRPLHRQGTPAAACLPASQADRFTTLPACLCTSPPPGSSLQLRCDSCGSVALFDGIACEDMDPAQSRTSVFSVLNLVRVPPAGA